MKTYRVIYCLNQFFGGVGSEEKASMPPVLVQGAKGPGLLLQKLFPELEVTYTLVFGDNYIAENPASSVQETVALLEPLFLGNNGDKPDLLLAGPAFNAGRYGLACGAICKGVHKHFSIPTVTGMYPDNPAVEEYQKDVFIVRTGADVMALEEGVQRMGSLGFKLLKEQPVFPEKDAYIPQGFRKNFFDPQTGAFRAVEMLMKKLKGEPFETEYPMPTFDRVEPAKAIVDMSKTHLALVTSGGIVPSGNPDRISAANAQLFGTYSLEGLKEFSSSTHQTAHGGYDPTYANADPNRVLPLDAVRQLQAEGLIGSLYEKYFATVGNATSVDNAREFGKEIAKTLVRDGVKAVILTSTWGTCTRCGATMVKEIERAGIPVVHACSIVPISKTVGANRIVPTIAIPHPFGDPDLTDVQELKLRKKLVKKILRALATPVKEQTVF